MNIIKVACCAVFILLGYWRTDFLLLVLAALALIYAAAVFCPLDKHELGLKRRYWLEQCLQLICVGLFALLLNGLIAYFQTYT